MSEQRELSVRKSTERMAAAADTLRRAAGQVVELEDCRRLQTMASRIDRAAAKLTEEDAPAIKVFSVSADQQDIMDARRRQAIQIGDATYLPAINGQVSFTGLPNILLRSAFFSVNEEHSLLENAVIYSQDGATLTYTGPRLGQVDKQVYGAVLRYYQEQPLLATHADEVPWISAFKFITDCLGATYSPESHLMVRDSLRRLGAADLRARHGRLDVSVPRLLSVDFEDAYIDGDAASLRSSDKIRLRITVDIAPLFGPNRWSAIPHYVPRVTKGLIRWLSDYYATHSVAKFIPVSTLFELSGESSKDGKTLAQFRADLKAALKRMQGEKYNVRVKTFQYSAVTDSVQVSLVGWRSLPRA